MRSGTSIGANVREAKNAASKADFINKLKEADETQYWLELLHESEYINETQFYSIYEDSKELVALLTSIVRTSRSSL